jgi:hypothetical protein
MIKHNYWRWFCQPTPTALRQWQFHIPFPAFGRIRHPPDRAIRLYLFCLRQKRIPLLSLALLKIRFHADFQL